MSFFDPWIKSFDQAKSQYAKIYEDEVKKAFKKFDKDGNGRIDKEELEDLSKKLGHELSEK
jgi:Ca2+-binding EF-hand superfamily protein